MQTYIFTNFGKKNHGCKSVTTVFVNNESLEIISLFSDSCPYDSKSFIRNVPLKFKTMLKYFKIIFSFQLERSKFLKYVLVFKKDNLFNEYSCRCLL